LVCLKKIRVKIICDEFLSLSAVKGWSLNDFLSALQFLLSSFLRNVSMQDRQSIYRQIESLSVADRVSI